MDHMVISWACQRWSVLVKAITSMLTFLHQIGFYVKTGFGKKKINFREHHDTPLKLDAR